MGRTTIDTIILFRPRCNQEDIQQHQQYHSIIRNEFRRREGSSGVSNSAKSSRTTTHDTLMATQLLPGGNDNHHHHPIAGNNTCHNNSDSNERSSPSQDPTRCGAQPSAVHSTAAVGAVGVAPSGGPCVATAYGTVVWPALPGIRSAVGLTAATPAGAPGGPPSSATTDRGGCHEGSLGAKATEESPEECGETVVSPLCACFL